MAVTTIDLTKPLDAQILSIESIIHSKEINQVIQWVEESAKIVVEDHSDDDINDKVPIEHFHRSISVLGTRGSGKTTFLLTLLDYIQKSNNTVACVLPIVDPTLIEEKGHVFLNVISIIQEQVDNELARQDSKGKDTMPQRRMWESQLSKLAHGLPSIDGLGTDGLGSSWQDAEYIMGKGIQSLESARNLKHEFSKLVQLALRILRKKYFVLAFDDIDVDFKKGWPVLETLRKYLVAPQIISVVSGNLQLYSLAVRKHYLENFGMPLVTHNAKGEAENVLISRMLTEMESQYLLKVLKPERRIHLVTLFEKTQEFKNRSSNFPIISEDLAEPSILIQHNTDLTDPIDIIAYYGQIWDRFGIRNRYQKEVYSTFLLGLPIRTQIQFLSTYTTYAKKDALTDARIEEPFLTELFEKRVDINLIKRFPHLTNIEILKFLLREKSLGELYQLQPVTADDTSNTCAFSLGLQFTQNAAKNSYLVFDYFIKIGYLRNILSFLDYDDNQYSPSIIGLCKHAGIYDNKVLRDTVGSITAYLKGTQLSRNSFAGLITLPGLGKLSKQSTDEIMYRIDTVLEKLPDHKRIVGYLPASLSSFTMKNQTAPTYSIYMLLGAIGEIIRKAEQEDLEKGLIELSQLRTYSIPDFEKQTGIINPSIGLESVERKINENEFSLLSSSISHWVKSYPIYKAISPHLLGKISTRFYYAVSNIESYDDSENLGMQMSRRVVAFLNAVLIEEAREEIDDFQKFNINNTGKSDLILRQNLTAILEFKTSGMSLSKWIFGCPLLNSFLKPDRQLLDLVSRFASIEFTTLNHYNLFHELNRIEIKTDEPARQDRYRRSKRNSYSEIAKLFRERNVPFEIFALEVDYETRRHYNDIIRQKLQEIAGINNWSPQKIRAFRMYLANKKIKW